MDSELISFEKRVGCLGLQVAAPARPSWRPLHQPDADARFWPREWQVALGLLWRMPSRHSRSAQLFRFRGDPYGNHCTPLKSSATALCCQCGWKNLRPKPLAEAFKGWARDHSTPSARPFSDGDPPASRQLPSAQQFSFDSLAHRNDGVFCGRGRFEVFVADGSCWQRRCYPAAPATFAHRFPRHIQVIMCPFRRAPRSLV